MADFGSTSMNSKLTPETPGAGVITEAQFNDWLEILRLLPPHIASDPSSQFCNPSLAAPLLATLRTLSKDGSRITEDQYEVAVCGNLPPEKINQFLKESDTLLRAFDIHFFHNRFHSATEVPMRLEILLRNLRSTVDLNEAHKLILRAAAPSHDLLHLGTTYAQRMTPGQNISNEERAVIVAARIALEAGLNPIQALELQRTILPTSFRQKSETLGIADPHNVRIEYVNGPSYDLARIDGKLWSERDLAANLLVRDYDPEAGRNTPSRSRARLLALADVLVTVGSFTNFLKRTQEFFLETKVGQGYLPDDSQEFMRHQTGFLEGVVRLRLNACRSLLNERFLRIQNHRIDSFIARLEDPTEGDQRLISEVIHQNSARKLPSFPDISGIVG